MNNYLIESALYSAMQANLLSVDFKTNILFLIA